MQNIFLGVLATTIITLMFGNLAYAEHDDDEKAVYKLKAKNAHLVRHVTGSIIESIRGVPAIPVDSFDWSGQNLTKIKGRAKLEIDPVSNTGKITAHWHDEYGNWSYKQKMFVAPSHPTGVKFGPSINSKQTIIDDPITTNVYLHGDTGAGAPVLPTLFNLMATWGPAKVTLNDELFPNTYDGTDSWPGHTMISEGVRDENGAVRTTSGEIYNMMKRSEGVTYPEKLTFHIVFHSMPGSEMTANIPPPVGFFYHITFTDVKLKIRQDS